MSNSDDTGAICNPRKVRSRRPEFVGNSSSPLKCPPGRHTTPIQHSLVIIGCGPTTCTRHQRTHSCAAYLPWASQPPQIYSLFYPWCSSSLLWCTLLRFTSLWCTGYTVTGALYLCDYVHIPPPHTSLSHSPSTVNVT